MARPFGIAAVPLPPRSLLYRCAAALPYCRMNELYDLDNRHNSEIRSSWFQLCINAGAWGGDVWRWWLGSIHSI